MPKERKMSSMQTGAGLSIVTATGHWKALNTIAASRTMDFQAPIACLSGAMMLVWPVHIEDGSADCEMPTSGQSIVNRAVAADHRALPELLTGMSTNNFEPLDASTPQFSTIPHWGASHLSVLPRPGQTELKGAALRALLRTAQTTWKSHMNSQLLHSHLGIQHHHLPHADLGESTFLTRLNWRVLMIVLGLLPAP